MCWGVFLEHKQHPLQCQIEDLIWFDKVEVRDFKFLVGDSWHRYPNLKCAQKQPNTVMGGSSGRLGGASGTQTRSPTKSNRRSDTVWSRSVFKIWQWCCSFAAISSRCNIENAVWETVPLCWGVILEHKQHFLPRQIDLPKRFQKVEKR